MFWKILIIFMTLMLTCIDLKAKGRARIGSPNGISKSKAKKGKKAGNKTKKAPGKVKNKNLIEKKKDKKQKESIEVKAKEELVVNQIPEELENNYNVINEIEESNSEEPEELTDERQNRFSSLRQTTKKVLLKALMAI
jgi:hypothetical protein